MREAKPSPTIVLLDVVFRIRALPDPVESSMHPNLAHNRNRYLDGNFHQLRYSPILLSSTSPPPPTTHSYCLGWDQTSPEHDGVRTNDFISASERFLSPPPLIPEPDEFTRLHGVQFIAHEVWHWRRRQECSLPKTSLEVAFTLTEVQNLRENERGDVRYEPVVRLETVTKPTVRVAFVTKHTNPQPLQALNRESFTREQENRKDVREEGPCGELLLGQYGRYGSMSEGNTVLVTLGDDFRYGNKSEWTEQYNNYKALMDYINHNTDLYKTQVQFATPKQYFTEKTSAEMNMWKERLAAYSLTISYTKGKNNVVRWPPPNGQRPKNSDSLQVPTERILGEVRVRDSVVQWDPADFDLSLCWDSLERRD
ncbi:hypothetical protein AAG570_000794 [Ranatra chinensis]|uniref:Glycoside hydrolase family 38 N-terminal domain-containing protein n=1 Tax=Ranatra chinensis TaxID=642074 RepID=A0ABD0YY37_9HEMI